MSECLDRYGFTEVRSKGQNIMPKMFCDCAVFKSRFDPVFKLYSKYCCTFVNVLTGDGHFDKPYALRMPSWIEWIENKRIIKKS